MSKNVTEAKNSQKLLGILRVVFCFYGHKLLNTLRVEQTTANVLGILENKLTELSFNLV